MPATEAIRRHRAGLNLTLTTLMIFGMIADLG